MDTTHATSVGLIGDGDEIAAMRDVEHAFDVKLDYSDAPHWHTAGDVFASLRKQLPSGLRDEKELWARFVKVLSAGTGVDPKCIAKDSRLLSQSGLWRHNKLIWIAAAGGIVAAAVGALLGR